MTLFEVFQAWGGLFAVVATFGSVGCILGMTVVPRPDKFIRGGRVLGAGGLLLGGAMLYVLCTQPNAPLPVSWLAAAALCVVALVLCIWLSIPPRKRNP